MLFGFEINNEPRHSSNVESTFNYINGMVAAIRSTGTKKPLFYNASHNMGHQSAYFAADIQGVTYQWYPTGLVSGSTRKGNYLPVVDSYVIPFDTLEGYNNKAKIVYEFDPADVLYSHLFPAIARTFRSEGFQWITQFAYDPVDLAWANTEYQTHYLNLLYTPAKAVSMKIAAQAAYSIPRNKKFPKYPNDTIFGDFTVSYNRDLSLMNSAEKFLYSGTNDEKPVNIKKLCEVTGCGSSRVVKYSGTGVYFLDKVSKGVWRLEVMPDVVYLDDPFSKTSLKKQVAAISNEERDMEINIPDLGESFTVEAVNKDGNKKVCVVKRAFKVFPGI